jgi:hypothetical protein
MVGSVYACDEENFSRDQVSMGHHVRGHLQQSGGPVAAEVGLGGVEKLQDYFYRDSSQFRHLRRSILLGKSP